MIIFSPWYYILFVAMQRDNKVDMTNVLEILNAFNPDIRHSFRTFIIKQTFIQKKSAMLFRILLQILGVPFIQCFGSGSYHFAGSVLWLYGSVSKKQPKLWECYIDQKLEFFFKYVSFQKNRMEFYVHFEFSGS